MLQLLNAAVTTARLRLAKDALARFLANAFPLLYPVLRKAGKRNEHVRKAGPVKDLRIIFPSPYHFAELELSRTLRKELSKNVWRMCAT